MVGMDVCGGVGVMVVGGGGGDDGDGRAWWWGCCCWGVYTTRTRGTAVCEINARLCSRQRDTETRPLAPYFKVDGEATPPPQKRAFILQHFALPSSVVAGQH